MPKTIPSLFLSILLSLGVSQANAIEGGDLAVGSPEVVALLQSQTSSRASCSAALIDSLIVVTAAHCVTVLNSDTGELLQPPLGFWVSTPGENLNIGDYKKRIRVKFFFRTANYVNTWKPSENDYRTQVDDIAFLVLEKEMANVSITEIANAEEVALIKQTGGIIQHLGYGLQEKNKNDGRPYKISLNAHSLGSSRYSNSPSAEHKTITTNETGLKAICPGDSGSPWYAQLNGKMKLVAVTVGGSGCGGSGTNGALGTVAAQYNDLYSLALAAAQEVRAGLSAAQAAKLFEASKKKYKNCSALWKIFPGGIGKSTGSANRFSLTQKAYVSSVGYTKNRNLDKDKDGVVCER